MLSRNILIDNKYFHFTIELIEKSHHLFHQMSCKMFAKDKKKPKEQNMQLIKVSYSAGLRKLYNFRLRFRE